MNSIAVVILKTSAVQWPGQSSEAQAAKELVHFNFEYEHERQKLLT